MCPTVQYRTVRVFLYTLSGSGGTAMDHTVCHFEIPAEEPKRAAEFYRRDDRDIPESRRDLGDLGRSS